MYACVHVYMYSYSHLRQDCLFFPTQKQYLWILLLKTLRRVLEPCILVQEFELEVFFVEEKKTVIMQMGVCVYVYTFCYQSLCKREYVYVYMCTATLDILSESEQRINLCYI
jgi:hypothetical protein